MPNMTPSPIARPNQAAPSFQMPSKQNMNQAQQPAQDTSPRYGGRVDSRLPIASPVFDGANRRVSNRALLVAQEELFGSTPNSPLMNRPSKLGLIMQSYEQLLADRSPRHGSLSPSARGRFAEDTSSEVSRDMPIIGQLYQVRMPHIILRENCEISQNNAIIAKVYQGNTVKILRHEISSDAKLRVQVITSEDKIGWCTMNTAKGDELLVLVTEEV